MSQYSRGARIENKIVRYLKDEGYEAVRSAGSKGAFDVIAYNDKIVRFIQAKYTSNRQRSYPSDVERIEKLGVPENCTKELWVYVKHIGFYVVYVLSKLPCPIVVPKKSRIILSEYTSKNRKKQFEQKSRRGGRPSSKKK